MDCFISIKTGLYLFCRERFSIFADESVSHSVDLVGLPCIQDLLNGSADMFSASDDDNGANDRC